MLMDDGHFGVELVVVVVLVVGVLVKLGLMSAAVLRWRM